MKFILHKPIPEDDLEFIAKHVDIDKLKSMRGIITGSEGWFGAWMCATLDYIGCEYDRLDMRYPYPNVTGDYCIYLAKGSLNGLIEALIETKVEHVLFTSSGAVYDNGFSLIREEKIIQEFLFKHSGLPVNIARVFTVIGGGVCQRPLAAGKYIKSCIDNEPIRIMGDGKSIRSYIYMADLIIWLLNILFAESGNAYDVGGGKPVNMIELAQKINGRFKNRHKIEILEDMALYDPHLIYLPDCSKAKNMLGLEHYTDLDTALDKTIEWERR